MAKLNFNFSVDMSVESKPVTEYEKKCKEWLELYNKYCFESNNGNIVTMFRRSYDSEFEEFTTKFLWTTDYLAKINPELFKTAADMKEDAIWAGIYSKLFPYQLEYKWYKACSDIYTKLIHG